MLFFQFTIYSVTRLIRVGFEYCSHTLAVFIVGEAECLQ